jgi:DNA-binding transcriptional MerR regulator
MATNVCTVCSHPARQEIDEHLLAGDMTLQEISEWLEAEYPEATSPSKQTLSRHRIKHIEKGLLYGGQKLSLKNGQVVDEAGRVLESIGIAQALKTVVTIGIANILRDPQRIGARETIEALRLMKSLGTTSEELEEILELWSSSVRRPKKKATRIIEADVVERPAESAVAVADDPEAAPDDDDPWSELQA